jgi:hypothetical protein
MPSIIRATTTNGLQVAPDNSGSLVLQTNGTTTAVTIDTSQNVGIGTTTPVNLTGQKSVTINASGVARTDYQISGTTQGFALVESGYFGIYTPSTQYLALGTNDTERMRINSSGNVGIGVTNPGNKLSLPNNAFVSFRNTSAAETGYIGMTTDNLLSFSDKLYINSSGEVYIAGTTDRGAFNLQCNGTGVWGAGAYTNGSDERIKENITPIDSGLDVVAKLNPVTYKYKEDWSKDQSTQTGFIAQDLLVALEGKNYVDGIVNQSSEYMSVAYQNIIPILTKAIQEQQTIINDLKARIETLEAK